MRNTCGHVSNFSAVHHECMIATQIVCFASSRTTGFHIARICVLLARSNAGCLPHTSATTTRVFCCLLAEHRCSATQETPARCTHWEMTAVHSFSFLKMLLALAFEAPFSELSRQLARAFMRVQTLCCVRGSLQLGGIAPLFDPTL